VLGFEGGLAFSGLLPKVVRTFRARHPRAEVRILPVESEDQVAALQDGTISVGYGYHLPEKDPLVRCRVLFRDRLGVVLPKRHRLAARRTLRIADLKGERFIWGPRDRNPRIFDAVISAFRAQGQTLQLETVQEAEDGEAFLTVVASGEGLSFFAESTAAIIRIAAVLKRVRDLDVAFLGRSVWLAADETDPLISSLLEITNSAHSGRAHPRSFSGR